MVKIIEGIINGVIRQHAFISYYYVDYCFIASFHKKDMLEKSVLIGNSWAKPFNDWKPLGFNRCVLYA